MGLGEYFLFLSLRVGSIGVFLMTDNLGTHGNIGVELHYHI